MAGTVGMNNLMKNASFDGEAAALINGVIFCYAGSIPAENTTATATVIVQLTKDGLAVTTPMTATNGVNLGTASSGEIEKDSESLEGVGLVATSQLTHFRHYNADLTLWKQGTIGAPGSGAVMEVTTTAVEIGTPIVVTSLKYRF